MVGFIITGVRFVLKFFGFDKIATYLIGFFSSAGPLASFFIWIGKKLAIKSIVLPIQYTAVGALVVAKLAFIGAVISLITFVYNRFHDMIDLLQNYVTSSNSLFSVAWQVLESIGFVNALFDTLHSMSFVFFSILALMVSKVVLHSLKMASDEMFKIGLLLEA